MAKVTFYTEKEVKKIKKVFSTEDNLEERQALADKMGRSLASLKIKYYNSKNDILKKEDLTTGAYTSEEIVKILEVFSGKGKYKRKKRRALANELKRNMSSLIAKYHVLIKGSKSRRKRLEEELKVTHVTQPFEFQSAKILSDKPILTIGEIRIIMPTNKFTIGGITIEC